MGKTGGFLEYSRQDPGYRDKTERVNDFNAVEKRLPEDVLNEQAARCMACGTPFCHGYGCPLENVIPEVNELAYQKRWQEALDVLLSTNNFPEFTGRICPALCEAACVLGINDDAVTIRQLEKEVIEKGFELGYMAPRVPAKRIMQKVAVIGAGPAGLAVADSLNQLGYLVTVFEREKYAGGILRYGIPNFKLEKWVIDRRIELMEAEGIVFEMGLDVGKDVSFTFLRDRFSAICLTGGAEEPRDLPIPGRELKGIHFAMDFLRQQNKRLMGEEIPPEEVIDAAGKDVIIIGGGDTGSDCLGTSLRQKARSVWQLEIMPEPSPERPANQPWPEYPRILRRSSSQKEGGDCRWCVTATKFQGEDSVSAISGVEIEWKKGEDGRMSFSPKAGTEFEMPAQLVLLAMGFVGPRPNPLVDELDLAKDARGNLKVDAFNMTSTEGIFGAGDTSRGQSLVVKAIADGRQAAQNIANYLQAKTAE
jgi:glutamate synthase (NADPH/NADH) small chain